MRSKSTRSDGDSAFTAKMPHVTALLRKRAAVMDCDGSDKTGSSLAGGSATGLSATGA